MSSHQRTDASPIEFECLKYTGTATIDIFLLSLLVAGDACTSSPHKSKIENWIFRTKKIARRVSRSRVWRTEMPTVCARFLAIAEKQTTDEFCERARVCVCWFSAQRWMRNDSRHTLWCVIDRRAAHQTHIVDDRSVRVRARHRIVSIYNIRPSLPLPLSRLIVLTFSVADIPVLSFLFM